MCIIHNSRSKFKIIPVIYNHIVLPMLLADDGSSLCCCWADDARAELLLRLQEVAHLDASVNLKLSKGGDSTKLQHTIGSCLEKMMKRHTCVIVKNCGIPPDFSCRDLDASSVLHKVLSRSEDKLLKFIILNACWNRTLVSLSNPLIIVKAFSVWINYLGHYTAFELKKSMFIMLGCELFRHKSNVLFVSLVMCFVCLCHMIVCIHSCVS